MRKKFAALVLLGCVAGFVAGLMTSNLIAPAYAAGNTVILAKSEKDIIDQCNFDKTMVIWGNGYLCVKK